MEPGEQKKFKSGTEDSEDESEILEESPCGRWLKRREEVQQRDVPGIDAAYLAMDTEEGVEVVWNEVRFSERKKFKAQEDKIRQVFDNLIQLEHPNIVKFHKYWIDSRDDKPRVIFITEYMSSGSLKQFLKRTKRNVKKPPLQAWKRWCTQILSALSFLHSCSPPIVHGNLTCDTIFIQHNGLIKIGSVAPDAIHQHVKTCREGMRNTHFWAPEFGAVMTPAADIYSFGVCALEMAALEIQGNGDSSALVTEDQVQRTIEGLEVAVQKDFIRACLKAESTLRPTARGLLFHPALFEVSPLKLLAAHTVVNRCSVNSFCKVNMETITDEVLQRHYGPGIVVAEIRYASPQVAPVQFCMSDVAPTEKLEKFVEDVKYGIYPLTVFAPVPAADHAHHAHHAHHSSHHGHHSHGHHGGHGGHGGTRTASPDAGAVSAHGHGHHGAGRSETPEPLDVETRRVANMMCDVKPKDDAQSFQMTLLLRMDDRMNRQLSCTVVAKDDAMALAEELVHYGFINEVDRQQVGSLMSTALHSCMARNRMGAAAQLPPAAAAAAAAAASPAASPAAASAASSPHLFDGDGDAEAAGVASPVATPSLSPVAVSS